MTAAVIDFASARDRIHRRRGIPTDKRTTEERQRQAISDRTVERLVAKLAEMWPEDFENTR